MEFCQRGEFEVLYGGAAGGGKSDALIMEALRDVGHEKYHGLILRRTFPQLQEIIDRTWEWYPKIGGQYRANKSRWEWPNGAKITLGHMQHEKDIAKGFFGETPPASTLVEVTQLVDPAWLVEVQVDAVADE